MFAGSGMWLSLVERCVRDAKAAGSNPVIPTIKRLREKTPGLFHFSMFSSDCKGFGVFGICAYGCTQMLSVPPYVQRGWA